MNINEKEEIRQEVRYLSNKSKIKTLVNEVGIEHILKYLIEDIDSLDVDSDYDLWKFRVADSLEDAYDQYTKRFRFRELEDAEDKKSIL